jgi:hypothetical protein
VGTNVLGELTEDMQLFDSSAPALRLGRWIALATTIQQNEPRFLRQVEFPGSHDETWKVVLSAAENEPDSDWIVSAPHEYEHWSEALGQTADRLEWCVVLNGALADQVDELASRLREASTEKERIATAKEEEQHERATELTWDLGDEIETGEEPTPQRPLTVDAVMADL